MFCDIRNQRREISGPSPNDGIRAPLIRYRTERINAPSGLLLAGSGVPPPPRTFLEVP